MQLWHKITKNNQVFKEIFEQDQKEDTNLN
jgi:hypothetical protein